MNRHSHLGHRSRGSLRLWRLAVPLLVVASLIAAGGAAGALELPAHSGAVQVPSVRVDTGGSPSSSSGSPSVVITPTKGLHDGQVVDVSVRNEAPHATLLVVECYLRNAALGEDGCENRRDVVMFAGTTGSAGTTFGVLSSIRSAAGNESCIPSACALAVVRLTDGNAVSIVGLAELSFSSSTGSVTGNGPPAPPTWSAPAGVPRGTIAKAGHPDSAIVTAGLAGVLGANGAITGPGVVLGANPVPSSVTAGVGLLQLVLASPDTSWSSATHTAAVVDVQVDSEPPQQVVLFAGARPFTYALSLTTLSTGRHRVTVSVDTKLSTAGSLPPEVRVIAERLSVVTRSNPEFLPLAYAPVLYGRPDTARYDTPLLTDVVVSAVSGAPAGTRRLTYTTIWTKEDAGTSFVPWLELGEWGRMTDITETTSLEVSRTGVIEDPMYDSCGCSATYPVERTSPIEEEVAFHGSRYGTHLIVRNASGNDYQADFGTTPFRMEQAPIPGPSPGEARETVMDANPWTYRLAAAEISRRYDDASTSPLSPQIGDTRQYAVVDVSSVAIGTSAIGVELRLSGSSIWYANDFGSAYSLYDGGHGRTAVKLPLDWESQRIVGVRLVAYPSSATWSVRDVTLEVVGLTAGFGVEYRAHPTATVVRG